MFNATKLMFKIKLMVHFIIIINSSLDDVINDVIFDKNSIFGKNRKTKISPFFGCKIFLTSSMTSPRNAIYAIDSKLNKENLLRSTVIRGHQKTPMSKTQKNRISLYYGYVTPPGDQLKRFLSILYHTPFNDATDDVKKFLQSKNGEISFFRFPL